MNKNSRKPDACDMLAEALKQMDSLLADTSHSAPNPNGLVPKCDKPMHNGGVHHQDACQLLHFKSREDGVNSPTAGASVANGTIGRRMHSAKAVNLCSELRLALAKLEDRAAFLQLLPTETRTFLQLWFTDQEKNGSMGHLDDGPALHGNENMKLDLGVENSRLRLRLGRMERELQSLEDKFTAAQRRISDLHSSLNERTIEVTGLTSRLARTAHTSPDRGQNQELEKLKHVVAILKMADDEKNSRIEELHQTLNKYKKLEEVLLRLKKSQILEDIQVDLDGNEDVKTSGEEDTDSLCHKTSQETNRFADEVSTNEDEMQLRSLSAPRLATATHQEIALSPSLPLASLTALADSSSSYDNLASYKTVNAVKKENFGSHRTIAADDSSAEPASPPSATEKRPPLPPHSVTCLYQTSTGAGLNRQHRAFASMGKGILKFQGDRWSRSSPSLVTKAQEADEAKKQEAEQTLEQEEVEKSPTKIRTKKSQPSGLKKFFEKMKRNSQDFDSRIEEFKRSPLRSTVGARLGHSDDLYDINLPFARWDTDRVALWLHVLGLSMYIGNCRRWIRNGEQLLMASSRDLEKELGIHNRFHRKKLQLALQAVTSEKRSPVSDLDHNWVARWLDDIGLPQYKDQFYEARIDGRLLHNLTVDELLALKVTTTFHHLSFKRAIQVLRVNNFNQTCLIRRPSSDEVPTNCAKEVMLWTNHRVMEWLRSIDLSEYAPNLRGSGVHGALMILEPRFGADVFASLLSIPSSKTLLRRHLSMHFVALMGNTIQQQKRELESRPGYMSLAPNHKVKTRRSIFRNEKPEEFVCPMDLTI